MHSIVPSRINAIDLARGIAVSLMILSHGIIGLLRFNQLPHWAIVPIHLITKFSSTIFFLVFGISLAVSFAHSSVTDAWPHKRKKLIMRGLVILFWYKVLTIIEMSHLHGREDILRALLYQDFPSYAEILGFYALALLWIPFVIPLWEKSSLFVKALWPVFFALLSWFLTHNFSFWDTPQIKALFVEESGYYTWGQLSRAPFVFTGMFIGYFVKRHYSVLKGRLTISVVLAICSLLLFGAFYVLYGSELYSTFFELGQNKGKHPPEIDFILFSSSGAMLVISFAFLIGERGARLLAPLTLIGKDTLTAFVFHLTVLFVFYRYLFDLWLRVSYMEALGLTGLLLVMTAVWIKLNFWRKSYEAPTVSNRRSGVSRGLGPRELNAN